MRGRLAAPVAVVLLLAVVAAGSRTRLFHESEPALSLGASKLAIDTTLYLFVAFAAVTMALVAWALWPRDGYEGPVPKRRSWWEQLIQLGAAMALVALFVLASVNLRRMLTGRDAAAGGGRAPLALPSIAPGQDAAAAAQTFDWAAAGIAAVVIVLVGLVAWRTLRRRAAVHRERTALARELEEVLTASADDLRADTDARRAVIRCFSRMERTFAAHGLPRSRAEAPFEFVRRALAALEVPPDAVNRLTELFEEARFSEHPIGGGERSQAVAALENVRAAVSEVRPAQA